MLLREPLLLPSVIELHMYNANEYQDFVDEDKIYHILTIPNITLLGFEHRVLYYTPNSNGDIFPIKLVTVE